MWFGRLEAYQEERGDCLVPQGYEVEGSFKWDVGEQTAGEVQGQARRADRGAEGTAGGAGHGVGQGIVVAMGTGIPLV